MVSRRNILAGSAAALALGGAGPARALGRRRLAGEAERGLAGRLGRTPSRRYRARLRRELALIAAAGLASDLLSLADLAREASRSGFAVGPGRGASPGSLTLWALGITGVDPIREGLHVERWLDPPRRTAPRIALEVGEVELERLVGLDGPEPIAVPWIERRAGARGIRGDVIALPALAALSDVAGDGDPELGLALINRGDLSGVHALHAIDGVDSLLDRIRPSSLEELAAVVALCRPAAIATGLQRAYATSVAAAAPHPAVEPILRPTRGVLVYQEQLMSIAVAVAGVSLAGADRMWRDPEASRETFRRGCESTGISRERAGRLFGWLRERAGDLFCRAHAIATANLALHSAAAKAVAGRRYLASFARAERRCQT
jgi:DNA polymerase III alpha subunit